MRRGYKAMVIATALFALLAFTHVPAFAIGGIIITDRYAAPNGSGTTCSQSSPCTVQEAINQAQAGEHVILKDGTYTPSSNWTTARSGTASKPITIRAQNRHMAIIKPPPTTSTSRHVFYLRHSHIILRGIEINGNQQCCWNMVSVRGFSGNIITGVVVEDMRLLQNSGKFFYLETADNIIVRWNYMERSGYAHYGEAFYVGASGGGPGASNVQIYANTIIDPGAECIDVKSNSHNIGFHHNICEGAGWNYPPPTGNSATGSVTNNAAANNTYHNNIIRRHNGPSWSGFYTVLGGGGSGNRVHHNVMRDSIGGRAIGADSSSTSGTTVDNNTWCNLVNSTVSGNLKVHSNHGLPPPNAPASACDAEEARILKERDVLPGNPSGCTIGCDSLPPSSPTGLRLTQ